MPVKPIILVEDNDKIRRLYMEMLEGAGYVVMSASSGQKAIELLHKVSSPQLVILDIMMPEMDGIETCERIRKLQTSDPFPIVFLTAMDKPETLLRCLRAGGDDYLMKSIPLPVVLERLQAWIRRRSFDDIAARREKAIKELEAITAEAEAKDRW